MELMELMDFKWKFQLYHAFSSHLVDLLAI